MTSHFQYPTARVSGGAPVPSSYPNADAVPGRTGVRISTGQSAYESAMQPQDRNPPVSGEHGVTGTVTGGAHVSPVPAADIFRAFNLGFDTVEIARIFEASEAYVYNILARGDGA